MLPDTPDLTAIVEADISAALGQPVRVTSRTVLGGGCVNHVERVRTTSGSFIVKSNPAAPPGFFGREAAGLRALAASGTTLVVPEVVSVQSAPIPRLVMTDIGAGQPASDFHERVGRGLAELHRRSDAAFGFSCDTYCGATLQPNPWTTSWLTFFGEARLGHQLKLATDAGRLPMEACRQLAAIIHRLDRWIDEPSTGPSLIHGDLWTGNLIVAADGRPGIIDPAAAFCHREAEFGIMRLFGGFSSRVFDAYGEHFPFEPEWRARVGLYELYHLLNHLNLFGAGYLGHVLEAIRRFR